MGKIFGISDNPVSTISSSLTPIRLEAPKLYEKVLPKNYNMKDKLVTKEKPHNANPIIAMRNGIGKLMSHFSHPKLKNLTIK